MLGRPARLFGVELFGESAADLVEDQADQRLGPADVGGRDDKIERNRLLRLDEIGDAPVTARGNLSNSVIPVEAEKRTCRRKQARPKFQAAHLRKNCYCTDR